LAVAGTTVVLGFPILFLLMTLLTFGVDAFVLAKLWGWLIVPAFKARPLSIAAAATAVIVWRYANRRAGKVKGHEVKTDWFAFLLQPVTFLLIGYAVHLAHVWGYIAF
jgi:hypothetical protein